MPAGSLLDIIEKVTDEMARFADTARGSQVFGQVMATVGAVLATVFGTLQRVVGMLGNVFGPIMPDILAFIEAFAELKSAVLDTALDALEPILQGIGDVLGGVVLPALTALAEFLVENRPLVQGIGIAILTLLVPAFVAWAVSAGAAAVATIIATGPIILLGAAIAGLAALVIIHFDTIKKVVLGVFNWIKDHWPLLLVILTGPFGLAMVAIAKHWDTINRQSPPPSRSSSTSSKRWWRLIITIILGPLGVRYRSHRRLLGRHQSHIQGRYRLGSQRLEHRHGTTVTQDPVTKAWAAITTVVTTAWNAIVAFLTPAFNALLELVTTVWDAIYTVISTVWNNVWTVTSTVWNTIWTTISTIWSTIQTGVETAAQYVYDVVIGKFNSIKDTAGGIWRSISSTIGSVWDSIKSKVQTAVNFVIGVINGLISGVNWVLRKLGLPEIGKIPTLGAPGRKGGGTGAVGITPMATGGLVPLGQSGPFMTKGPMAVVGEGRRQYPEYVIPTDPKFRRRALGLYTQLGGDIIPGMAFGGTLGNIFDAGKKWVSDRIKDVTGLAAGVFRGALGVGFAPFNAAAKAALNALPNPFGVRDIGQQLREAVYDWVKGADSALPTEPPAGGGPGGTGIFGFSGLQEPFASKLKAMISAAGGLAVIWINSGRRSIAQQAVLYRNWLAGVPGQARAAPPGRSKHEQGLAADLGGNKPLAHRLAPIYGLRFPVRGEDWHIELGPGAFVLREGCVVDGERARHVARR